MRDLINSANLRTALADLFGESIRESIPARLGKQSSDGSWVLKVPDTETDRPNMYYISNAKNAAPFVGMALNTGPTPLPDKYLIPGMPIRVRKESSGSYSIFGLDPELAAEFIGNVNIQPPQAQIPLEQFLPGMLDQTDPASLKFRVFGAPYTYNGAWKYIKTITAADDITNLDDTSAAGIELPAAGLAKYVLVQLDFATETLSYIQGDKFDQTLYHLQAYQFDTNNSGVDIFPTPDAGCFRCGYIRLQSDTTEITRRTNIWTMQTIFSIGGSGGSQTFTGTQGETVAVGDPVYQSDADDAWYIMDTDASPPLVSRHRAIVTNIDAAPTITLQSVGVCESFTSLTAGDDYWMSTTGTLTNTRPNPSSGGGQIALVYVGRATSTTAIDLKLDTPVQYMIRDSVADDGTLTIEHHSDSAGRLRDVRARISTNVEGDALTEYASSNYDTDVALEGPSGAGGTVDINATGTTFPLGNAGGVTYWAAQSFQITAGQLSQIKATLDASTGTPSGTLTWEIRDNNTSVPGTVLQSGTWSPTASTENTVNITGGMYLAGSTTYWLVVHPTSAQSSGNYWNWVAQSSSVYAGGNAAQSPTGGASWSALAAYDAACQITTDQLFEYDRLAQSFQLASADSPYSIKARLRKVGSPTGTMTMAIYDDSGGEPNALVTNGTADTIDEADLTTSYADIEFLFSTPPSLSGSTTYWGVLDTDRAGSATDYIQWATDASSPSYTDGQFLWEITSTWDAPSYDGIFAVMAQGTSFDGAVDVGHITVGSPTIGTRFDDGAGADADINTTFQNLSGATLDLTCIVEIP